MPAYRISAGVFAIVSTRGYGSPSANNAANAKAGVDLTRRDDKVVVTRVVGSQFVRLGIAVDLAGQSDGVASVAAAAVLRAYNLGNASAAGVGTVASAAILRSYDLGAGSSAGVGTVAAAPILRAYNLGSATASGAATASAALALAEALIGASAGGSSASGALASLIALLGSSAGVGFVPQVRLSRDIPIFGINSHGVSLATGVINLEARLRGQSDGLSQASASHISFTVERLQGQSIGLSQVLSSLSRLVLGLHGQSIGLSMAFGDLDVEVAFVPSIRGSTSSPPQGLGLIRHQLVAPTGEALVLRLGSWECLETAAGGFISASGIAEASLLDRFPAAFSDGASLRSFLVPTEELVWAGRLLDPAREGGKANLIAEGYGRDAEQAFARLLWQNDKPSDFYEQTADPANVPADEDKFAVDITDGRIKVSVVEGTALSGNEEHGAVFGSDDEDITRIAFTLKAKESHASWVVRIYGGPGPEYDAATWVQIGSDISLASYSGPIEVDEDVSGSIQLVAIMLHRASGASTASANAFWIRASKTRVNGRATGDDYGSSAVARDLFGLLAVSALGVQELGGNALPRDVRSTTAAAVLNDLAVLVDASWGILDTGSKPYGSFRRWGDETLFAPTARGIRAVPQRRYDSVGVPFRTPNPNVKGLAVVDAPYKLRKSRQFVPDVSGDLLTEEAATAVAAALAPYMVSLRHAGDGTLYEVIDHAGQVWPAHRVRAGRQLVVPGFAQPFRLSQIRRTDRGVDVVFDESTQRINSIIARTTAALAA